MSRGWLTPRGVHATHPVRPAIGSRCECCSRRDGTASPARAARVHPPATGGAASIRNCETPTVADVWRASCPCPRGIRGAGIDANRARESEAEERRARDRNFIGIRVSDEGIGMTPEQLSHACERFYRADTSGNIPGTGLGLSLVKEIMELLGGSIEMESEFGRGSVATLWLPVAAHEARAKVA